KRSQGLHGSRTRRTASPCNRPHHTSKAFAGLAPDGSLVHHCSSGKRPMNEPRRQPYDLPPLPSGGLMRTVDELVVGAPTSIIVARARDVEYRPAHLAHSRSVRSRARASDGGGLVSMAAFRPFGPLGWPTWWLSEMAADVLRPAIRFRHV